MERLGHYRSLFMIRYGTHADLPHIEPFDPFSGSRETEVAGQRIRVFENSASGEVIGYLSMAANTFHGNPYVEFLCVAPAHRRAGVAAALVADAETRFAGRRLFVSTEETNAPMRALLARLGYRFSGALAGLNDDHGGAAELFFYKDLLVQPLPAA